MAKKLYESEDIKKIANSIRNKNGETTQYKLSEMSTVIDNLPSGGSGSSKAKVDVEGLKAIGWTDEDINYFQDNGVVLPAGYDDFYKLDENDKQGITSSSCRWLPKKTSYSEFQNYYYLLGIPYIDTSEKTSFNNMFYNCHALTTIPQLNTSKGTKFNNMFYYCYSLTTIPQLNTSEGTNFYGMFYYCYSLTTIPQLNTSKGTSFSNMFNNCNTIKIIPQLDTFKGTSFENMFSNCTTLTTIPQLDTSSATNVKNMFSNCTGLKKMGGLLNIGKAYGTNSSANYSNYTLSLNSSIILTEESIINVLNKVYDIAGKGCNTQTIQLGSTNLAKLKSAEGQEALASAQAKGWTIS